MARRKLPTRPQGTPANVQATAQGRTPNELGERVASGAYGDVWLSVDVLAQFRKLKARTDEISIREARTLDRYFQRFADAGPESMDARQFKPLGRYSAGVSGKVQVFEFKAFQYRIYGVCRSIGVRRAFIGLSTDPSKQTNKADRAKIAEAATLSAEWA